MIVSYLKISGRGLGRYRMHAAINIMGLAFGMASAMLIGLWIYDELSFNRHFSHHDKIARIRTVTTEPLTGAVESSEANYIPVAHALKTQYGMYFKHVLLGFWKGDYTLSSGNTKLAKKGKFIEPGVIQMLSLNMIAGGGNALTNPNSIILSESAAISIFGNGEALGKPIRIDNRMDVTVTGIFEDLPRNTDYGDVQFFAPWDLWVKSNSWVSEAQTSWNNNSFPIEVQIADHTSFEAVDAVIRDFYQKNAPAAFMTSAGDHRPWMNLYPMSKWHLYSRFVNGYPEAGRMVYVWLFGIAGLFILVLACINFVNLSTAISEKRAREVGIRKALGASRRFLIFQFLFESFILVFLSFLCALLITWVSLGWFNTLAGKNIEIPFLNPYFWLVCFAFMTVTTLLSGGYPALYIAAFQPVRVLKGMLWRGRQTVTARKVLVVFQFMVSIILMSGVLVVRKQINHGQNRALGYDKNGLLSVHTGDAGFAGKHELLAEELMKTGMVLNAACSSSPLTEIWNNTGGFNWPDKDERSESDFSTTTVSYDFGKTVGWHFIAGRDFSREFATDSTAVIINETARKHIGLKDPIGKSVRRGESVWVIVGVIDDMVMGSPFEPVKRGFYFLDKHYTTARQLTVRLNPGAPAGRAVSQVKAVVGKAVPSALFDYTFVDTDFAAKFDNEQRVAKLVGAFSILAVFISCLGLLGLVSFMAKVRRKEISVRKVLGAGFFNLWRVLCAEFVNLVCMAMLLAVPLSWYILSKWLAIYAYHTELSWWVFAYSGLLAIVVTVITVSIEGIKGTLVNPVNVLRSE